MRGWMLAGLLLMAGAVQAEELSLQYNARIGVEHATKGNYYLATRSFEAAAKEAREKFAADLAKILPLAPEGWAEMPDKAISGEAPMLGGTFVSKTFAKDDREIEVGLVVDSAMLTAMMDLARSVGAHTKAEQYETNATANTYTAEMVKGAFILVKGRGMTEAEGRALAAGLNLERLAQLMGIGAAEIPAAAPVSASDVASGSTVSGSVIK